MRKITSILSMFLLIAGWNTASAQFAFKKFKAFGDDITNVSQLEDGGYYVLQNYEGDKCVKIKTDGSMVLGFDNSITDDDASNGLAVFKLHIDNSGTTPLYSFESACTGYYIPTIQYDHHKQGGAVVSTTAGQFELRTEATLNRYTNVQEEPKAGYFTIKNSTDNNYLDVFSSSNLLTGWEGNGDRAWFKIRKATLNEEASAEQVFYKVVYSGEVASTTYGIATTETQCPVPNTSYYFSVTQPSDLTITETNNLFEFNITKGDVPFTAGQWYSLKIKQSNQVLRGIAEENNMYVNTETGSNLEAIANTYPNFLNALWRIEESGLGVKIYNKAVGKYLKGNGVGNTKGLRATFDNTGTVFYVKSINGGLGFYTGSGYLNACCPSSSTGANTRLGLWNAAGNGSTFYCEKTKEELLALGKTAFANTPNVSYTNYNALKKGGNYSKYKSSVDAATTLDGLFEIGAKVLSGVCPDPNAYYLIRNVNQGAVGTNDEKNKYLSSEYIFCDKEGKIQTQVGTVSNDINIKRTKKSSPLLPRLWQFEEATDGKYYLRNVNTQKYVALGSYLHIPTDQSQGSKTAFSLEATNAVFGSEFRATNDTTTMFLMGANNTFVNAQNGMGADGNGKEYDGVATWTAQNDGSNYWQFIKVTEVPLTIAANDYTTLCLPFNVKLPENSAVKAYYASAAAGEVLKLEEITNGIIPANEGVILHNTSEAEAANINLTITTEEATLTENKLKGVTAKREGYTKLNNYVLAAKNGATGFYKANFTAVTANKAYLPVANVQGVQGVMMAFSFGDEVTGIDNVNATAPAAKKYYDLQGRRVLYPAKGIFVTEDGQKVLFK